MSRRTHGSVVLQVLDVHLHIRNARRSCLVRAVRNALHALVEERSFQLVHVHRNGAEVLNNLGNGRRVLLRRACQEDAADVHLALLDGAEQLVSLHAGIQERSYPSPREQEGTIALILVKENEGIPLRVAVRDKEHFEHLIESRLHVGVLIVLHVTDRNLHYFYS